MALDFLTDLLYPLENLISDLTGNEHLLQIPNCRKNALEQSFPYNVGKSS